MAVFKIVEIGDPVLRQVAKPVKEITPNIIKLLENMADTMYDAEGVGLAAPQIGISKRVIVVDVGEGLIELINPEIIHCEGKEVAVEGCLSVPGKQGDVERWARVKVRGLNRQGELVEYEAEGLLARAFQHEIDHLDGILYVDKAENLRPSK
ncbi:MULTISPECIES: peptide deformylase [Carboxydocella]|uniref:Peptide deformylase n=2 Tax=Carboxydocella TaxID=178898 RepID=A0A1T4MUQ2_9FIRM|nr:MULTISPECIES: peptide deformylase [Carboxydocella]AVX20318.1 peptide deformylase [Carboxydocella thermautotrophica]AVX30742.1 peptide deformylase [Carboxydocella thermautotrophica]SJZ70703.1 peptide deformylase [Carboxydocella sporoproducens DSM 16521]GAW30111.1 peptide deformylase [Carboxydocella sp. ULO1]GAW31147.1 peptide deformylase [Carboxydocella sp. JDF658]